MKTDQLTPPLPTITTIIPTYKRPELLLRAIKSVQKQKWNNIDIIVRDNHSRDGTKNLVLNMKNNDSRIKYIENPWNIGAHENIRQGIKNVATDFFSILSDDDYLEPDFYTEALKLFEKYPNTGFVVFKTERVDLSGKPLNNKFDKSLDLKHSKMKSYYNPEDGFDAYLRAELPYIWTGFLFRRCVAENIGLGDFSEMGYAADIAFIWHAAARYSFATSNVKGANITIHDGGASTALVNLFDERRMYWERSRMLAIKNDYGVSLVIREKALSYYLKRNKKLFRFVNKYYIKVSLLQIISRLENHQKGELSCDLIAMRSFIFPPILRLIRVIAEILIFLKFRRILQYMKS